MSKRTPHPSLSLYEQIEYSFANHRSLLLSGDNLTYLESIPDEQFQLIYLDPPFFTGKERSQVKQNKVIAYQDRWSGGLTEYLNWLSARLEAVKRILTPTGTVFVHLDHHASHYVKIELDRIFGREHFRNEIVWHYTGGGRSRTRFSAKHDTIFWYSKSDRYTFHIDAIRQSYKPTSGFAKSGIISARGKQYLPHPDGTPVDDVWSIPIVNPLAKERNGYPTQKPEALLERIIAVSTNPGDWVGDFFCGSGTTCAVAERLGRKWVGCDASEEAIQITEHRIQKDFPQVVFDKILR